VHYYSRTLDLSITTLHQSACVACRTPSLSWYWYQDSEGVLQATHHCSRCRWIWQKAPRLYTYSECCDMYLQWPLPCQSWKSLLSESLASFCIHITWTNNWWSRMHLLPERQAPAEGLTCWCMSLNNGWNNMLELYSCMVASGKYTMTLHNLQNQCVLLEWRHCCL